MQPPRGHPTSLCSHDRDSVEKTGLTHPHRLFILLPYSMELFNQQWERCREDAGPPPEYLGAGHVPFLMTKTIPTRIISTPRKRVQCLLQNRHIVWYHIVSYHIISYCIASSLLFSVHLLGLIFVHLLPAHSDFPMYVNHAWTRRTWEHRGFYYCYLLNSLLCLSLWK